MNYENIYFTFEDNLSYVSYFYKIVILIENFLSFTENGLLSYENPNYHLDPARLESAIYSELYDMHEDKQLSVDEYDNYLDNRRYVCINVMEIPNCN